MDDTVIYRYLKTEGRNYQITNHLYPKREKKENNPQTFLNVSNYI